MAHWDFLAHGPRGAMKPGPSGLHPYADNLLRLGKVPAVTISAIDGRVRGAGSEFVLSTDIRFAGPNAVLGQFEVGVGAVPGAIRWGASPGWSGGAARWRSCWGATTSPRSSPPVRLCEPRPARGELDDFVDTFARRIAGFDKVAVAGTKHLTDSAAPIPTEEFRTALTTYFATAGRPENAHRRSACSNAASSSRTARNSTSAGRSPT